MGDLPVRTDLLEVIWQVIIFLGEWVLEMYNPIRQTVIKQSWSAVVVAPEGRWRDGLLALLQTLPKVTDTHTAWDLDTAIASIIANAPDIILIDADLKDNQAWRLLNQLQASYPAENCVILAGTQRERHLAYMFGARAVMLKGFTAPSLERSVARILFSKTRSPRHFYPA